MAEDPKKMSKAEFAKFMTFFSRLGPDSAEGERMTALAQLHKVMEKKGQSWNDLTEKVSGRVRDAGAVKSRDSEEITEDFLKSAAGLLYTAMKEDLAAANKRAAVAHANADVWRREVEHLTKELAKAKKRAPRPETAPIFLDDQIMAAIKKHPNAGDREIARLVECAPATVGKARAKTGKPLQERTVIRKWPGVQDARQERPAGPASGCGIILCRYNSIVTA